MSLILQPIGMDITQRDEYIFSIKPSTYFGKETF